MKRLIVSICLILGTVYSANAVLRAYVSDSGRVFYYYDNRSDWCNNTYQADKVTDEERKYVSAQVIRVEEVADINCDREQFKCEANEKFKNEVYKLYKANYAYMADNFNVRYTFDEIYDIVMKFASKSAFNDGIEGKYYYDIHAIIYSDFLCHMDKIEKYNKEHPYWLGYLYKEVKYDENGKRLKEPTSIKQ